MRAHTDTPVCVYIYSNLCMRAYMKLVQEQAAEVKCVYIHTQVRVHIHEFIKSMHTLQQPAPYLKTQGCVYIYV